MNTSKAIRIFTRGPLCFIKVPKYDKAFKL